MKSFSILFCILLVILCRWLVSNVFFYIIAELAHLRDLIKYPRSVRCITNTGINTSCSMSCADIAFNTFFLLVSCTSPPIRSSSSMKYAFSKLKMMSSSQTYNNKHSFTMTSCRLSDMFQ